MIGNHQYAADTSFVIALLRGSINPPTSLKQLVLPHIVAGELLYGALTETSAKKAKEVRSLISRSLILNADEGTAKHYAQARWQLRKNGTPIPENDVWIAACCIQHELKLLTLDKHFERVEGLQLELQEPTS